MYKSSLKYLKQVVLLLVFFFAVLTTNAQNATYTDLYSQGVRDDHAGEYALAIMHYSKCIELKKDFSAAYFNRGLTYRKTNENEKALEDFLTVIKQDEEYVDAYSNAAEIYLSMSDIKNAQIMYEKALRKAPGHQQSLLGMGTVYYFTRQYVASIEALDRYLGQHPDDAKAFFQRGLSKFYNEDKPGAMVDFSKSISINPKDVIVLEMRAQCYKENNQLDLACADWTAAAALGSQKSIDLQAQYCKH